MDGALTLMYAPPKRKRAALMNLLLVGCGNIGSALLETWSKSQTFNHTIVIEPTKQGAKQFAWPSDKINFIESSKFTPTAFEPKVVVLAIKPQALQECMPELIQHIKGAIVVSLLAGVSTQTIAAYIDTKIVRIMPNLAIRSRQSVNLAFANSKTTHEDIQLVDQVFALTGKMTWLDREELIDTLTPISGAGPAYFFLLSELLVHEAIKLGLDDALARSIVQQTLAGSSSLATNTHDFEQLITNVASKGGVTEAALKVMRPAFEEAVSRSFSAAFARLKELGTK